MQERAHKYSVKGRPSDSILKEARRRHIVRNLATEIYRAADSEIAAAYADVPDIAQAMLHVEQAQQAVDDLRAARRQNRADPGLAPRLAAAREEYARARETLIAVKAANKEVTDGPVKAAAEKAESAVAALYGPATSGTLFENGPVPGCLYWPTFNSLASKMATAMSEVIKLRAQHKPAELRSQQWAGGTVVVQLQRSRGGVPPEIRSVIAELHATGLRPGGIAKELAERGYELSPRSVGLVLSAIARAAAANALDGAERAGDGADAPRQGKADPPRSPELLASGKGRWRNILQICPEPDGKHATVKFRISSGIETLRIVLSRPLPPEADVTRAELTVREVPNAHRGGDPYYKASLSVIFRVPDPPPLPPGRPPVAVHTGWRVLEDGSIRVAVIAGASVPPPPGIGATHKNPKDGSQEYGLRDHGTWQEIVIAPGRRVLMERVQSLQGIRDRHSEAARAAVAAHLAEYPDHKEIMDPGGTLDRWKSPRQFAGALSSVLAAEAEGTKGLAVVIAALRLWHERELHLAPWQYGERARHVTGWRQDTFRKVATWLAGHAGVIILDSWSAVRTRPADGEDTGQMKAARANAVLASPGELRLMIRSAARREGVPVKEGPSGSAAVHHGCGGDLSASERAAGVMVVCRLCGRRVDQDRNVLAAMLASAREGA